MKYDGPNYLDSLIETENLESILEEIDAIWLELNGQKKDVINEFPHIYRTFESELPPIETKPGPVEPLTTHSNVVVKNQRLQNQSLKPIEEANQKLQDIDNTVLLEIDIIKTQHRKITDEALLKYTGINITDLTESKKRLIEQRYLIGVNCTFWHRFTQKGKEHIEKLKKEAEFSKKRPKCSSVSVEHPLIEPKLIPIKSLTTYFDENVKKQSRQSPPLKKTEESRIIDTYKPNLKDFLNKC